MTRKDRPALQRFGRDFKNWVGPRVETCGLMFAGQKATRELNRLGVTSLIDSGGGGQNYPEHYQAIAKLAADKALTVRIGYTLMAQRPGREIDDYKGWLAQAKLFQGDDYFRLCGAGEYIVWAAGDVTNFAKDPLPQPPIMEEKLTEVIKFVALNGWPFHMHASFDFTAQRILAVVEKVHQEVLQQAALGSRALRGYDRTYARPAAESGW